MSNERIGFIGGGNMATAIIRGLRGRDIAPERIAVSDPSPSCRHALVDLLGGGLVTASNEEIVEASESIVLAVKPQIMKSVLTPLREPIQRRKPLLISIAAGIRSSEIDRWLGGGLPVVRCMPNQPALIGEGMTVLFANDKATSHRHRADAILAAAGPTLWVNAESMIDAATAISGSGPAYFFYLMEALVATAREFGFSHDEARLLVNQTARGAAAVAESEGDDLATLRARVTSPGGTTAAALGVLEAAEVRDIFRRAFLAARTRAGELADGAAES